MTRALNTMSCSWPDTPCRVGLRYFVSFSHGDLCLFDRHDARRGLHQQAGTRQRDVHVMHIKQASIFLLWRGSEKTNCLDSYMTKSECKICSYTNIHVCILACFEVDQLLYESSPTTMLIHACLKVKWYQNKLQTCPVARRGLCLPLLK